jgi:Ala-tRNA(Pro) deacylase
MPKEGLKEYLESNNVHYEFIEHTPVYTAQEIAATAHIPGKQLAKTVMVKIDGEMAMAVLLAPYRVNFEHLKEQIGSERVELASEGEFKDRFPDCEPGAMPPFGNLYGMKVYADKNLAEETGIAFCAGAHGELIRISYKDFENLAQPEVIDFAWKL